MESVHARGASLSNIFFSPTSSEVYFTSFDPKCTQRTAPWRVEFGTNYTEASTCFLLARSIVLDSESLPKHARRTHTQKDTLKHIDFLEHARARALQLAALQLALGCPIVDRAAARPALWRFAPPLRRSVGVHDVIQRTDESVHSSRHATQLVCAENLCDTKGRLTSMMLDFEALRTMICNLKHYAR